VFVIEVMGRQSGYLAMASAVAAGADGVLLREQGRTEEAIVDSVAAMVRAGITSDRARRRILIIKAEGVEVPCTRLVRLVQERLVSDMPTLEIRGTVLGHLVRGGRPSYQDRMIAGRLSLAAVDALLEGVTDTMLAWMAPVPGGSPTGDPAVSRFTLARVLEETDALLDGTSVVTRWRLQTLNALEGALGL
jgi:6-phosphofructokinase 1